MTDDPAETAELDDTLAFATLHNSIFAVLNPDKLRRVRSPFLGETPRAPVPTRP